MWPRQAAGRRFPSHIRVSPQRDHSVVTETTPSYIISFHFCFISRFSSLKLMASDRHHDEGAGSSKQQQRPIYLYIALALLSSAFFSPFEGGARAYLLIKTSTRRARGGKEFFASPENLNAVPFLMHCTYLSQQRHTSTKFKRIHFNYSAGSLEEPTQIDSCDRRPPFRSLLLQGSYHDVSTRGAHHNHTITYS